MKVGSQVIEFKDDITLIPISDIHLGSRACDEAKFDRLVKWILGKKDCYVIGLGDYVDAVLRQDVKRFTGKCSTDEMIDLMDSMLNAQRNLAIRKLKPLADAGRILGLGEGNHEQTIKKHHSFDIMQDICGTLGVPYLGYSFLLRLTLKKKSGGVKRNCVIYGHHGYGGGRRTGASINKLEDAIRNFDFDICLMGHDHQKLGKRFIRLGVSKSGTPKLIKKPIVTARTGTFMRTCIEDDTTYSEQAGYPPTDTGVVKIKMRFYGHDKELDIHVSE